MGSPRFGGIRMLNERTKKARFFSSFKRLKMNKDDLRKILSLESYINLLKVEKVKGKEETLNVYVMSNKKK